MNLSARIALVGGVAVLLSLGGTTVACGGRDGGGSGGGSGGSSGTGGGNCAPFCAGTGGGSTGGSSGTGGSTGGSSGTGGSTGGSSGTGGSGGVDAGQIAAAKSAQFCSMTPTRVLGVVVTAVQSTQLETGTGNVRQNFWVVEASNPSNGLYVFKDYTDTVGMMTNVAVNVGDVLNIDGNMTRIFPDSFINNGAEAYRYQMSELCGATTGPMRIVVTGTATPPADIMVSSPFGLNPDGGKPKGYFVSDQRPGSIQPMAGARVHIPGPLTLSNAAPVEMQRINSTTTSFGFEVTGTNIPAGVLVRTQNTFGTFPDGGPRCDYGQMVRDGGRMVSFPNGIRGVWDTFSQTGCVNGTTSCTGAMSRDAGVVPGLGSNYTFVVFPMDCNDLAGAVVTP